MKLPAILLLLTVASSFAVEPWADSRLTVTNGVELWFDASREPAARQARKLAAPINGKSIDFWHDASGHARHVNQRALDSRPQWRRFAGSALVYFDGQNDFFAATPRAQSLSNCTVVAMVAPQANPGFFRGFFSCNALGKNDFQSGLNIDLGGAASTNLNKINVEGGGMPGEKDLLSSVFDFGGYHLLTLTCDAAGAALRVDGKPEGKRERKKGSIALAEFTLGARQIDMQDAMPYAQSFFHGGIAELVFFNRVLDESELQSVEDYFTRKHSGLLRQVNDPAGPTEVPLVSVPNPPPVQVFVPGFAARELPIKLKNLNNLVYAPDGRLFAFGYNGNVYQLSDTDGDGLEDKAAIFFDNARGDLPQTIGMAWGPGGLYIPIKGRIVRLRDTGKGQGELETVFSDWKPPARLGGTSIDSIGITVDKDGNIYFGLCADDWISAYRPDEKTGQSQYQRQSERGAIVKVSSDWKTKEVLCSGLRFTVDLAINHHGDVFCTEQEGATWLPNGNPFDELLHIQKGRHYGFPPRHPKYLPDVIDEPSTFDYAPQHQSTCGMHFNDPAPGGQSFGPARWRHDALVAGESRGKIWRTKLVKTPAGYVAQNQLIASLSMLAVDTVVTPRGALLVACHSGAPDWGTGPNGEGKVFHISYRDTNAPQPVLAWNASPTEMRVTFDRPLDPAQLRNLAKQSKITMGKYVSAGDRFETLRPGYRVVQDELATPRYEMPVLSASLTPDRQTLALATGPRHSAVNYALALPGVGRAAGTDELPQHPAVDLLTDLTGVEAEWKGRATNWSGWLPHLDLQVARELTSGSAEHSLLWNNVGQAGALKLRAQLDLYQMLRAATQPGSTLDYEYPPETVTVVFKSNGDLKLDAKNAKRMSSGESHVTVETAKHKWLPIEVVLSRPALEVTWHTAEDPRPRALQLRRILLPWAKPYEADSFQTGPREVPEIAGGDWQRGREIFFNDRSACYKCHTVRGEGGKIAPDLSNLVHRDYASVMKDILQPSAAINPDAVAYNVHLKDGDLITGVPISESATEMVFGDINGQPVTIKRERIAETKASSVSLMPEGLLHGFAAEQVRDLMTFLLRPPEPPKQASK